MTFPPEDPGRSPQDAATPRILIVEDEPKLAGLLADYLAAEHYSVEVLRDGAGAVEALRTLKPDLVLLDLMLPGKNGLDICREARAFSAVPIIMITARVEEVDRLLGLELGADDYICKPFSPREVVARVKAVLRRAGSGDRREEAGARPASGRAAAPLLAIDADAFQAAYLGRVLDLTPAEFRLLRHFAANSGKVFSREQLLASLYDDSRIVTDRTVDTHVKNLRRKLQQAALAEEERGGSPVGDEVKDPIRSVYGVGYKFQIP